MTARDRLPKLTAEPTPSGYPEGYRAYRFFLDDYVVEGLFGEIRIENGRAVFKSHRGMRNKVRRQDMDGPQDSHIVIPEGGYVDSGLLEKSS